MKYLNLGCGHHYSNKAEWTNLDFVSGGESVLAHNLLKGIPFQENSFDLVYHSHVLEHFSKQDGAKFISECFRVLKPGGILRIAIPDLERIAKEYLNCVENGIENFENSIANANYQWMLLEMYDQTVRNHSGGNMGEYLYQETLINEDFVFERIGEEGKAFRENITLSKEKKPQENKLIKPRLGIKSVIKKIKRMLNKYLISFVSKISPKAYQIGKFRLGGEIHQWMYDRYSLTLLLKSYGGHKIQIRDAFTSYVKNWEDFELDGKNKIVRKPDSLFIEAVK